MSISIDHRCKNCMIRIATVQFTPLPEYYENPEKEWARVEAELAKIHPALCEDCEKDPDRDVEIPDYFSVGGQIGEW